MKTRQEQEQGVRDLFDAQARALRAGANGKGKGPGKGWWGPPKGTHGPGSRGGAKSGTSGSMKGGAGGGAAQGAAGSAPTSSELDNAVQGRSAANEHITRGIADIHSSSSAKTVKHDVVSSLSEKADLTYGDTNEFVRQWAVSSNDEQLESLLIQQEAADEFGVRLSDWQQGKLAPFAGQDLYDSPWVYPPLSKQDTHKALRTMYNHTQDVLKEEGITELTLFRGILTNEKIGRASDTIPITSNALSSWTTAINTARGFADAAWESSADYGYVIAMKVPVGRVLSTAKTGFGCLGEQEFVLLGGDNDVALIVEEG